MPAWLAQQHNPAMSPHTNLKGPPSHGTKARRRGSWLGDAQAHNGQTRYMKHPWGNRSFLELSMHMQRLEGLTSSSTCKSWTVKWMDGSKVELTINSPALRNPKKPRQQAAHSMTCSELWVSKECWIIRMVGCHWLALCESWALVALNAPERALKLEAVHQGIG